MLPSTVVFSLGMLVLLLACIFLISCGGTRVAGSPVDYVKPFMGTEGGGNMFPGVALPFGVVKLGIDVQPPGGDAYSGYAPNGDVTGFSMMHESGTGGAPKYGVVSQIPIVGEVANPLANWAVPRAEADYAEVGYYRTLLNNGVEVGLTASRHTGVIRYTFPKDNQQKNVLVDVSHFLPSTRGGGIGQQYIGGEIVLGPDGRYTGYGLYKGGWNFGPEWKINFCGTFSEKPEASLTFQGAGETLTSFGKESKATARGDRVGALFIFSSATEKLRRRGIHPRQVQVPSLTIESKIGISFISTQEACKYIEKEIPKDESFASLVTAARDAWNGVLSKVTTSDTNREKLELLYTAIYGMFLIPSDRTGENPGWVSSEPYYDDAFTLWDLFRCHMPLFHILQPKRYTDFIRSLIDIWRHDGFLPDGRSSNFNGRTQGGSNADNVLADAFVKGVRDGISWEDGYSAMVTDAEVVPPNTNGDPVAKDGSTAEGRGALPDWKQFGFITTKFSRSVSRASEYSANDHALAIVAKGLGMAADAEKYLNRSMNWRNHWDPRMKTGEFTGFLSPINADGKFPDPPYNPMACGGCYWEDPYFQALPFEYSFGAHHDVPTLIKHMGGDDAYIKRLEKLFDFKPDGGMIIGVGNEPSFASPYLFNFVPGQQWRTVEKSRYISRKYYHTGMGGLPGNSDAGAMQSWLLWSLIGLYPMTGTTTFLISSPQFRNLVIDLGDGKRLEVTSEGGSEENGAWFVQSLKVNRNVWNKSWVSWDDVFKNGGKMEFVLGEGKRAWDTGDRPLWDIPAE